MIAATALGLALMVTSLVFLASGGPVSFVVGIVLETVSFVAFAYAFVKVIE